MPSLLAPSPPPPRLLPVPHAEGLGGKRYRGIRYFITDHLSPFGKSESLKPATCSEERIPSPAPVPNQGTGKTRYGERDIRVKRCPVLLRLLGTSSARARTSVFRVTRTRDKSAGEFPMAAATAAALGY